MHSPQPALPNQTGTSEHNGRFCEGKWILGRQQESRANCTGMQRLSFPPPPPRHNAIPPPRAPGTMWFHPKLTHHREAVGGVETTRLFLELPAGLQNSASLS